MKNEQTIKRGAGCTAPVGPAGFAGRILAGAVGLLLISAVFGGRAWAITGGEPDNGRHPNVGAVIAYYPPVGIIPMASGTLVHERVFLTAGHVVDLIQSGVVTLLGVSFEQELNLEKPKTWLEVSDLVGSFTGADASPNSTDIGAIILKDPVKSLAPAPLPAAGFLDGLKQAGQLQSGPDGTRFTVVGYGWVVDWPPPQPNEWENRTRNVTQPGYLGLNDGWLHLAQNVAAGYGGIARGDSGGPTFWTDPQTGDEVLVSITSWGAPTWIAMGVSYRIDTETSLQFIQDVIDGLEE